MVMPLAGRVVAAVIGGLLVLTSASSVTGTLIVTRSVSSRRDAGWTGRSTRPTGWCTFPARRQRDSANRRTGGAT